MGTAVVLGESNNGEALSPCLSTLASPRNDHLQSADGALAKQTLCMDGAKQVIVIGSVQRCFTSTTESINDFDPNTNFVRFRYLLI